MKKIILILFLLSTKLTFGQINNAGFEVWDTTYTNVYSPQLSSIFGVPNPYGGTSNNWMNGSGFGISQTTDSYSGNYSLILHTWYGYAEEWITYHDSISYRPFYLQGYFKYITGGINGLSQGRANVTLTKFNGTSNDTIATGAYQFDSTASFTPFQLTLNYFSALNPDSIKIYFINGNSNCIHDVVCNLLYLDNLTLTNSPLGIENFNSIEAAITIFPNPSSNELNIQNNSSQLIQFTLYNSLGGKIIDKILMNSTNAINLSEYSSGVYFYKVSNAYQEIKCGKIIKQ